ncbi:hypothetical protein FITA111629_02050 [Filibacter tadaridae]|uniref:Dipicolinate synthase subunit A n=1 Tax=Filibacter tadaridae TaxID=2483811 RepID=A0A3P5XPF2_9BACL|nr:hypothetical protein [Filibacter tadaridae]VDC29702.1 dipicolinate synthase subunit A [Filibacter tadaridae]
MNLIDEKWLFIGADKRIAACSKILEKRGYETYHLETNQYTEELGNRIVELAPHHIVFPVLQMDGMIPCEFIREDAQLYVGRTTDEWLEPFKQADFKIHTYLKDDPFIWVNARLTAEAFVHEYYSREKRSIAGNQFLVAGFGKVGKMTAYVLSQLGSEVTILARSNTQLGEADALGYDILELRNDFDLMEGNLVNTIPAPWLTLKKDAQINVFDLASAPGCLTEGNSSEYYTVLLGLPGKHFPIDAATALADVLERMYRR